MWYNNDFSNDTAAGGFLNNTTNDTETPTKKSRVKRLQSVVPVVVKQIRDCTEEEFQLFGRQVQIVRIVGILKNYEIQSTKATYTIEDHTGEIKAVWWLESDGDTAPNLPPVKENNYVELYGTVRNQDEGKIVMVLKMFLIDDCNVVTSHLLEVISTRLNAETASSTSDYRIAKNNPGAALANSMSFMEDNQRSNRGNGLTMMQEKVFKVVQAEASSQAGISTTSILKNFPPNKHREVKDCIDFLNSEGHIYTTYDAEHFKPTDANYNN